MSESKSIVDIPVEYREEDENILEEAEEIKIEEQTNVTNSGPPLEIWVPANYADTQAAISSMQLRMNNLESKVSGISSFNTRLSAMMDLFQQREQQEQQFQQLMQEQVLLMRESMVTNDDMQTLREDMAQNYEYLVLRQQQSSEIAIHNDQVMERRLRDHIDTTVASLPAIIRTEIQIANRESRIDEHTTEAIVVLKAEVSDLNRRMSSNENSRNRNTRRRTAWTRA